MRLRRQYQLFLDQNGAGRIDIQPNNSAMEWKIFQVPIFTKTFVTNCVGALYHNGAYLHSTPIGSLDSASGPPYVILNSTDVLTIAWTGGLAGDQATATIWYEEYPAGTASAT